MTNPESERTWAELGIIAAALMHDLQNDVLAAEEYAALAGAEGAAGRSAASSACGHARQAREMIRDVLEAVSGATPEAEFAPAAVVRGAIERVAATASAVEIRFRADAALGSAAVAGRASLLLRAVSNLLRNGVRHAAGRVEVEISGAGDGAEPAACILVSNDGPEIPPRVREALFTAGTHGGHGGFGLGLASARWCVARLGGSLALARSAPGRTCFEIRLPLAAATARTMPAPPHGTRRLAGRSVVIVDDEPAVRSVVARLLQRAGARVHTPSHEAGAEALARILAEVRPDAVLLDADLGATSGVAVLAALRRMAPVTAERVVFFSGAGGWSGAGPETLGGRPVLAKGGDLADIIPALERVMDRAVQGAHP